jgi:PAS domain S-box-containing protein
VEFAELRRGSLVRSTASMQGLQGTLDALAFLAAVTDAFAADEEDLQASLDAAARAVLPALGDMCIIDVVPPIDEVGSATSHVDPELAALAVEYRRRWGARVGKPTGPVLRAMQGKLPVVLEHVGPEWVDDVARDPEQARVLSRFRPSSLYVVPMRVGGRVAGAMSFGFAPGSSRRPEAVQIALAEEVGRRIGWALDRARRESLAEAERAERVEAVRRSREAYRALVEHSPDIVSRLDRDKRHLFINRSVGFASELSVDDFLGRTYAEVGVPPALAARWEETVERVFVTGRAETHVYAVPYPAGARDIESRFVPELAADGSVATVIRTSRDVTAERAAARAMERANRGLRVLSHAMEEIARASSEAALYEEVCRTAVDQGGYRLAWIGAAEDAPGKMVRVVAAAGPAADAIRSLEVSWDASSPNGDGPTGNAIRTGAPAMFRGMRDDPRLLPWRAAVDAFGFNAAIALPITSDGRTIGALSLYAVDEEAFDRDELALLVRLAEALSVGVDAMRARRERDASEAALRAREEHFRGLIENASDAVLEVSAEHRVTYASPAIRRILGYEPAQIEGRDVLALLALLAPDARARASAVVTAALGTAGLVHTFATVATHHDGGARELEIVGHRPAGEGSPRLVLHARDVTERARVDAHLRESQKMDALNRLAAGIAHDFNNVLTIVQGAASMLQRRLRDAETGREEVTEILAAAERAASLTRQLLLFSRRGVEEPRVVDVRLACADVERMLRRLVGVDVELSLSLAERPARVRIDPSQLEQVVLNLAVNARDAMPQGGRLVIAAEPLDVDARVDSIDGPIPPGAYVRLSVVDAGVGVDPALVSRIFEPFFTTKPEGRGTGLGLSTVRSIVHRAGGYVQVESTPGDGARFSVWLPRVDAEPARAPSPSSRELRGSGLLLLVDDDAAVRRQSARALREHGYEIVEAADGEEAIGAYDGARDRVRAVITDLGMPRVRGKALAARLAERDPALPVLFVSALPEEIDARDLGPRRAFLAKPFSPEALLSKLLELLDQSRAAKVPVPAARA